MPLLITNKWLWFGLLAVFLVNTGLFALTRATFDGTGVPMHLTWTLAFGILFFALARATKDKKNPSPIALKLRALCEGMFFMTLVSLNIPTLNHLTMMLPFPFQDDLLANWDAMLGINWVAYFDLVHSSPTAIAVLDRAYDWLSMVGLIGMIALIISGDWQRNRFYMEVFFYTAVACVVIGAGFPALAAVDRYLVDLAAYTNFPNAPGVYHIPYFEDLRAPTGDIPIKPSGLPGLVTFPSYHTASGVLLSICFFRTRLFWPMTIYSVVMIASSPVYGGHYFIDLVAGAAFAAIAAYLLARRPRYHGLFSRDNAKTASLATPEMA